MSFPPKSQLWHCGIARVDIDEFFARGGGDPATSSFQKSDIVWLPMPGPWRYIADPFGIRQGNSLFIFVEAYDYLTKKGTIHRYAFDASLRLLDVAPCLEERTHLSYPFVFKFDGEFFMLPEQSRSGQLTLYRAKNFPDSWEPECVLMDNIPAVDPSLIEHDGRWWMFFSIAGERHRDRRELHLASAAQLTGPWHIHPQSPIIENFTHGRPGGTPWKRSDGRIILPLQDCSKSYGGGLSFAKISRLDVDEVKIEPLDNYIEAKVFSEEWKDGTHTLSRCGDVTLFDVKKYLYSFGRYAVDIRRELTRLRRRAL